MMYRKLLVLFTCFCLVMLNKSDAQNLTGIWRGHFATDGFDQYKFELQIEQSSANSVSGVSYSYLSTIFYGKATLTGNYNKSLKTALVQEIKTVELRMSGGSVACIMKCQLKYSRSGNEEFLEGTYTSTYEKSAEGVIKGGNCGGGKVFLRKVATSDFYVEPFLRKPSTQTPINVPPKKSTTAAPKQQPKTTTTTTKKPPVNNTTIKKPTTQNTNPRVTPPTTQKAKLDSVKKLATTTEVEQPKKIIPKPIQLPAQTRSRSNDLVQTFEVENEEILVKLYDNGEVDGDTISVYLDKELVLSNKRLTTSPLSIKLKLNEDNPEHVLVMVAENLGRIPPNTSLMIVDDGNNKYQVRITSTEQKNAMVRFRLKKKGN